MLVRVHAAGVDRGVWHLMAGLPYPIRLAGYGFRAPKNPVPGTDVAGVVEAVGEVIDYTRDDFATATAPYVVIVGGETSGPGKVVVTIRTGVLTP